MRTTAYLNFFGTVSILLLVISGCQKDNSTAKPGNKHTENGHYDASIADYTEAIRLDPKDAKAYFYRGLLLSAKKEYDAAIADLSEAIRLDPQKAILFYYRGVTYTIKEEYDAAIADLSEAIRLDPKNANAYHFRSLVYEDKGENAKAEEDSAKAEKLGYSSETDAPIDF